MLLTLSVMKNVPLIGIQTGRRLAQIGEPIINPNNLQVVAWYTTGNLIGFSPAVVFSEDIHELGHLGAIIDSADDIHPLDNLVRLQEILSYDFALKKLPVVSESGQKLGLVESFNFDSDNFLIKQIIVKPSFSVRLTASQLIITRHQIVELNNQRIVVSSVIRVAPTPPQKSPVKRSKSQPAAKPAPPTGKPVPETKHV
ncbi:MAG: hypothetical protein LBU20_02095 [Candidatus Nomurabacteria bacterium]|jgi:uncharacterized protein YrrD|nr:hypothetical protein [Candidatus Nomurabacteria bacterium]